MKPEAKPLPEPPFRCMDCGQLHGGVWLRCTRCESAYQQDQRLERGSP